MKKLVAKIISLIFNPVIFFIFMPYIIIYKYTSDILYAIKWTIFSIIFIIVTVIILFIGKKRNIFSDYDLSNRHERAIFYIIISVLALIYLIISLFLKGIFFPMSIMSISIFIGIILFMFVNQFIKASIHMAIAFAFAISINILFNHPPLYAFFTVIPFVAWSRLELKRHTKKEMYIGSVMGSIITIVTFLGARYIYYGY
ncbi:MAG: hypothetical protein NTZ20_00905 [Candidatus Levybacteria bacterium]|nr:hypothetical protein [Candidatus Levybacteria bacterium]MSU26253.1 hypothetical protein [Candidatus Levybacteria bacterium]